MILERVWLKSLRNFDELQWSLHPRCNVVVGDNGSGKTTFLESIYLLSRGQSFRTRSSSPLIQFNQSQLMIHARTADEERLYLEKNWKGQTKLLLNEKRCQRFSDITKILPCQLFHQDLFQIIDASSQIRRRLLDWGLFYHHPDYAKIYRDFKKVLLQRNYMLKQKASHHELQAWMKPFVDLSEQIDEYRQVYVKNLYQALQQELTHFSIDFSCQLKYNSGWDKQHGLEFILKEQEAYDRKLGFTHSGPHHADLCFLSVQGKGKTEWSRGQQKLILILLKIAQIKLLAQPCLFLFDDLAAELDKKRLHQLYQEIRKLSGQTIFTALDDSAKDLEVFADSRWFYLEDGKLIKTMDF
jgi:DNA replication and repair protein RecF